MRAIILVLFTLCSFSAAAQIEGVYTVIIKKQEEKKQNRWTLADWLSTKKTIALQDQWLALNSSSTWFEFVLDYGKGSFDEARTSSTQEVDRENYGGAFYIKFLGFEYNKKSFNKVYEENDWRVNLLLWGSSSQATNLRGFYGKRDLSVENYSTYDQEFYGGALTFYLADFLGLEGEYAKFSKATSGDGLYQMDGKRTSLGAFLEIYFLRFYYTQFKEELSFSDTSGTTGFTNDGAVMGVKLFF